jgi:hypothetical protein
MFINDLVPLSSIEIEKIMIRWIVAMVSERLTVSLTELEAVRTSRNLPCLCVLWMRS